MKKNLLKLIFAGIICLLGIGSAKAQTLGVTTNSSVPNTASIYYTQQNIALAGFNMGSLGTTRVTSLIFTATQNISSYFALANVKLVKNISGTAAYSSTTTTPVSGTVTFPTTTTVQISGMTEDITTNTAYYLVGNYNVNGATNVTINFKLTTVTSNAFTFNFGTLNTTTLTFAAPTISTTSRNDQSANGITPVDLTYGQDVVMFGFSITVSNAPSTVTKFVLNAEQDFPKYFNYTNFRLVKVNNGSVNYTTGNPQPVTATVTQNGTQNLNFAISESFSNVTTTSPQTNTYFVVATYNLLVGSLSSDFHPRMINNNITYSTGAGGTPTGGGDISGSTFKLPAPVLAVTGLNTIGTGTNGNGISTTSLYYGQKNVVMYGFSVSDTKSPVTINTMNLKNPSGTPVAAFFSNFRVYKSASAKFDSTATGTSLLTTTLSPSSGNSAFSISGFNQAFNVGDTKYYFIVGDYNKILNNLTATVQFDYDNTSVSVTNTSVSSSSTSGQTFNLASPILTISNYNSSQVYSGTTISAGSTYNMLGFIMSYTGPTNVKSMTIDISFPLGGDDFTSGYVNSVDIIDATTGVRPSYITGVNKNGNNIQILFDKNSPQSASANLMLKVKFETDFSVHKPSGLVFCINSATNTPNTTCDNYSNCTIVNNYTTTATGSTCSQTFTGANIYDWIGANNSNWNAPANWKKNGVAGGGSPSSGTDVVRIGYINYSSNNQPDMNGSGYTIGSLEIGKLGSTSATAAATVTLNLKGKDLTVNGGMTIDAGATFAVDNSNNSTANLNIASASVMASTALITFPSTNPVKINKTSGTFVLQSDANGTASIGTIPTGSSITGSVTVQRYFSANRTWRLMSTPVATSDFTSLAKYILITGTGGSTNGFAQPSGYTANGPSILFYNTGTKKFTSPGSLTSDVGAGSGFYLYYRGDNFNNLITKVIRSSATAPFASAEATVAAQTGTLNQQGLTITLSTGGDNYNLIGNPYPSSIIMPSKGTARDTLINPGTTGFVYTYSPGASSITPQPSAVTIASGQGFFVKAVTGATIKKIIFSEALKTTGQPGTLLMGTPVSNPEPMITLKMQQDSNHYDIAFLRFSDTYKKTYNEYEDADDLNGSGQTVFFGAMTSDAHEVAIASQPLEKLRTSVYLSVDGAASGTFKISKQALTNFNDKYDLILIDHFKKDSVSLLDGKDYAFNIDKGVAATFGNSRFELVVRPRILPPYNLLSFTGKKNTLNNVLNWTTSNEYTYTSFGLERSFDGKTFEGVTNMESTGKGAYTFTDQSSKPTIYYRLKSTDINDKVSYSSSILLISLYGERIFSVYPNPNPGILKFKLNDTTTGPLTLKVYNLMGRLMATKNFNTNEGEQDVSTYTTGNYIVNLVDSSGKLIASAKFIKM